jgi:hypothetical protein
MPETITISTRVLALKVTTDINSSLRFQKVYYTPKNSKKLLVFCILTQFIHTITMKQKSPR